MGEMAEKRRYLEFEQPLAELDAQIEHLKHFKLQGQVDVTSEIRALEAKSCTLLKSIFSSLTPYQIVQLSRHVNRPSTLHYIDFLFDDFIELQGDRTFLEDPAMVGGLASFEGQTIMVIGHRKGRNVQENMMRNFGMPRPEGYRKAYRLMKLAERWKLPLITFIDTPGAYPGIDAEERGQAVAIAENIILMTHLKIPILSVILGEGGSGGALAIGVADRLLMFQYSTYSVISPEGCAAITWKDGSYAPQAAEALCLTSDEILKTKVTDRVISEPLGGTHRDPWEASRLLATTLKEELENIMKIPIDQLLQKRYERYRSLGHYRG